MGIMDEKRIRHSTEYKPTTENAGAKTKASNLTLAAGDRDALSATIKSSVATRHLSDFQPLEVDADRFILVNDLSN